MRATPKKGKVNDSCKKCFCNKEKRYGKITTNITVFYDGKLEKFQNCSMYVGIFGLDLSKSFLDKGQNKSKANYLSYFRP